MKRFPILDVVSLIFILAVGVFVMDLSTRVRALERSAGGTTDLLNGAKLLPMPAAALTGVPVQIPPGRRQLIFYMSPRCGSCERTMPAWTNLAHQLGRNNVLFLLADSNQESIDALPQYLRSHQLSGFNAVRVDPEVMKRYQMLQLPRTILVSGDGRVQQVWRGSLSTDAVLQAWSKTQ